MVKKYKKMSFNKLLIHFVWFTKDRKPYLKGDNLKIMINHIKENAEEKGIKILVINGHENHLHAIISMNSDQTTANIMNLIKGESSHWANKNLGLSEKIYWQSEYFAVSVSQSLFPKVFNYILKQEEHHKIKSFDEEYREFIEKYGFED